MANGSGPFHDLVTPENLLDKLKLEHDAVSCSCRPAAGVYRDAMTDPAARLRLGLDAAWRQWQSDHGGVGIREMIAIAAVAIVILAAVVAVLHVVGFDVGGWLREQLGITSSG
jgi:hypothetical protein